MKRQSLWHVPLLSGLIIGLFLGLIYTWSIAPVQFYNTPPDRLRPDLKEEYILLIAETFAADNNWPAAQQRLAELGDPEITQTIAQLTKQAIAEGQSVTTIRHLATLAGQLGIQNPAIAAFVPTPADRPSPTPMALVATFTPTPAEPTLEPTPSSTPMPTYTPSPIPTPQLNFRLLAQQRICMSDRPEPMLQIIVRAGNNNQLGGIEIIVEWDEESARLYTGLKPELGRGYADLIMQMDTSYAVHLAAGSEKASGIHAAPCNSLSGPRQLSTRLVFERIGP